MKKRRKLISGATRHDMSVGCVKYVPGHEFVYLSDGDSGTPRRPWNSRCPMVTRDAPPLEPGQKPNAIDAWGVTVTAHQGKSSQTLLRQGAMIERGGSTQGLSLAPVCVVAVAGPVTLFWNWREGQDMNEAESPKMKACRDYVKSRGLVLHDVRPGIGMDVILYDSWDRTDKIGAI